MAVLAAALVGGGMLASCTADPARADGRIQVQASFYPLQWMAQQVGGGHVEVESITKPGAEPHDLELSPRDVGALQDADLVVYLAGFQPAIDAALGDTEPDHRFDASGAARLDLTFTPIEDGKAITDEAGTTDPHFWLDPIKLAHVADAFAAKLASTDPSHAGEYRAKAKVLRAKLRDLDMTYRKALDDCRSRDLVTSHNAFGYLARRYGLHQVSITGLTPEGEPSPKALADVTDLVEQRQVGTVYFETLVGRGIARTVADEAGVRTDVLDPIEGLNDRSAGRDYLAIMRANLANLVEGQRCR